MTWYTRLPTTSSWFSRDQLSGGAGPSPGLLFHKWHAFDKQPPALEIKDSRVRFLEDVRDAVQGVYTHVYRAWYDRHAAALEALEAETVERTTLWRLVAGYGTNPALESGLSLHPLLGVPYLPGSSVRGLVRHVAEMELLAERQDWVGEDESAPPPLPTPEAAAEFLTDAERVAAIFGSLSVERHRTRGGGDIGPVPPRFLLRRWLERTAPGQPEEGQLPEELRRRARALHDLQTGGRAAFYDALPVPGQESVLLQVDLLNPHYPDYYNTQGATPPSDDQDPKPVYFLALSPGVQLSFAFRAAPWRREAPGAPGAREVSERVRGWLQRGLTEQGAGAKTAAGYGYFRDETQTGGAETEGAPGGKPAPPTAAAKTGDATIAPPPWELRVRGLDMGNARDRVPQLLASLDGEERRKAARFLVEQLGRRALRGRESQEWVQALLAAAQG